MIEDFTYNINLNHQYPDLEANYKIVAADNKSSTSSTDALIPLYTIISDSNYTGATFSVYDSADFASQTDYFHRLHLARFPVNGCYNGIADGNVQYTGQVMKDNDLTPVPSAPIIIRLSESVGTPDYRTPVSYLNSISVTLKDNGGSTVATGTTQSIIPDPSADNLLAGFVIFMAVN